eukprot:350149-Chlamydomonas_euryale.AAC.10
MRHHSIAPVDNPYTLTKPHTTSLAHNTLPTAGKNSYMTHACVRRTTQHLPLLSLALQTPLSATWYTSATESPPQSSRPHEPPPIPRAIMGTGHISKSAQ